MKLRSPPLVKNNNIRLMAQGNATNLNGTWSSLPKSSRDDNDATDGDPTNPHDHDPEAKDHSVHILIGGVIAAVVVVVCCVVLMVITRHRRRQKIAVGIRPAGEAATAADKPLDPGSHEMGHFSTGFLGEDLQNRVRAELTRIEAQVHGQRGLSLPLLPLQDPHTDDAPGNWGTSAAENDMPGGTGVPGGGIPSQREMDTGTPGSPRRLQKQQQAGGGAIAQSRGQGQIGARAPPTRAASPQRYQGHTGAAAPSWGNLPSGAYAPGWISPQSGHLGSDAPSRAAVPQPWTMGAGAPEHAGPQQRMGADAPVVTFPRLEPTDTNERRVYRDDPIRNRSLQALLQRYELRPGTQRRQARTDDEVQIPPPQIYTDGQHPRQLDSYEGKIRTPLRRKRSTDKKRSIDKQQRNAGTHAPTVPRQVPMGTRAPGGTGAKQKGAGALEPRSDYPEDAEHTGIEMKHFGNPLGKPGNPSGKPASEVTKKKEL